MLLALKIFFCYIFSLLIDFFQQINKADYWVLPLKKIQSRRRFILIPAYFKTLKMNVKMILLILYNFYNNWPTLHHAKCIIMYKHRSGINFYLSTALWFWIDYRNIFVYSNIIIISKYRTFNHLSIYDYIDIYSV